MRSWWVSWYNTPDAGLFELHSPWWRSGFRLSDDAATVCAAVRALSEDEAKRQVTHAYDQQASLEWRFCEERPEDWSPFSERFPKADWMRWPT